MRMFKPFLRAVAIFCTCWILALAALFVLYSVWLRDYQLTWGATAEEAGRHMAGDELLQDPVFNSTRAVAIEGSPEEIWPWIVQIGYKRAGFYAFDKLDNAGIPSADIILSEYQDLAVGDTISLGGPKVKVVEMVPYSSMLWVFQEGPGPWATATWSWGLYRIDDEHTKLVSRLRLDPPISSLQEAIMFGMLDSLEIVMMRTCLLGIKHRVETQGVRS
jgi:hypothetical protein